MGIERKGSSHSRQHVLLKRRQISMKIPTWEGILDRPAPTPLLHLLFMLGVHAARRTNGSMAPAREEGSLQRVRVVFMDALEITRLSLQPSLRSSGSVEFQ